MSKSITMAFLVGGLLALAPAASAQVEPLAVDLDDLEWSPPGGGNGFPIGVRTATQGYDPISKGRTYYALFPAGSHFDLHWHTYDEYVVVVAGSPKIQLYQPAVSLTHAGDSQEAKSLNL